MNNIFKVFMVGLLTLSLNEVVGQTYEAQYLEQRDYQREFYSDYSRWSLGAYVGPAVVWGDMKSFAFDKTYIGITTGLSGQYQVSPTVGLRLSAGYTYNKAGSQSKLQDYMVGPDGYIEFGSNIPETAELMSDLYTKINAMNVALSVDVDVRNLFWGNDGTKERRWSYLVSPTVALQYFRPDLYTKDDDAAFGDSAVHYDWSFGLGGEAGARYKLSPRIDLEGRVGAIWVLNNKFDGISSATERYLNGIGYMQFGVRYKFGVKSKKDNLSYAPTSRYVRKQFEPTIKEVVKTKVKVKTVEVPVEKIVEVGVTPDEIPDLPTVNFLRGSAEIDEHLYAEELFEIVTTLKKYPDVDFEIWGYADHTGSEGINESISMKRAEALSDYLVSEGIDKSRIVKLRAMGKDVNLEGEAALSVVARRAVVMNH
ncbi:MAG: OmpA family protein [Rikenellaceae bacterium]